MLFILQNHLMAGMKLLGLDAESITDVLAILTRPEQMDEMMDWMQANPDVNVEEVKEKAAEIARRL